MNELFYRVDGPMGPDEQDSVVLLVRRGEHPGLRVDGPDLAEARDPDRPPAPDLPRVLVPVPAVPGVLPPAWTP